MENRDFFKKEDNFRKIEHVKSNLVYGKIKDKPPFITVVMPTYNRGGIIKDAIESVISQVDFDDYELVIVDNYPNKENIETETEKIIKSYNSDKIIYYRNEENVGVYANWNRCIELARSKWITMVHDDDALVKNHLVTMVNVLKGKDNIKFLACNTQRINQRDGNLKSILKYNDEINYKVDKLKVLDYRDYNFAFVTRFLGGIFDKEAAIDIGGFEIDQSLIEDYVFVVKFAYYYKIYEYDVPLYLYRWGCNISLMTEIWQVQEIYEYYISLAITNKRNFILRPFFKVLSKDHCITRADNHINGTSHLGVKCNINKEKLFADCKIKNEKINPILFLVCKGFRKLDRYFRNVFTKRYIKI